MALSTPTSCLATPPNAPIPQPSHSPSSCPLPPYMGHSLIYASDFVTPCQQPYPDPNPISTRRFGYDQQSPSEHSTPTHLHRYSTISTGHFPRRTAIDTTHIRPSLESRWRITTSKHSTSAHTSTDIGVRYTNTDATGENRPAYIKPHFFIKATFLGKSPYCWHRFDIDYKFEVVGLIFMTNSFYTQSRRS